MTTGHGLEAFAALAGLFHFRPILTMQGPTSIIFQLQCWDQV
jgi:hypothetical protein